MSDTRRRPVPVWYRKEKKAFRHLHFRAFRRAAKVAVQTQREIPRYRRTSGWLTW